MPGKGTVSRIILVDGAMAEVSIPKELVAIYDGRPRVLLEKLEWAGIHPLPIDVLSPELRSLSRSYEIVAIPKGMLG